MPLNKLPGLKLSLTEEIQVNSLAYERLSVFTVNTVQYLFLQYISPVATRCTSKFLLHNAV